MVGSLRLEEAVSRLRHFRKPYGTRGGRRWLSVNWYENRTNYDGWISLATNIRLPFVSIFASAWFNRFDDEEGVALEERRIEVRYSLHPLRVFRSLTLNLSWRYGDARAPRRDYKPCKHEGLSG
jgi:hypothetical protein